MDFVELCRKLISIDTSPSHGTAEAATWLADLARSKGLTVELQSENLGGLEQCNLILRMGAERPSQELMLETHLDTPDPGPFALWTKTGQNPFDAHIIDAELYGLGAADCKLDFLCKLEALLRFQQSGAKKMNLPPVLVGTFGEETGMTGALRLIRKNKVSAKYALIGEASDLKVFTAGNGFAQVQIHIPFEEDELEYRSSHNLRESSSTVSKTFSGKSAHSSTPERGSSAIEKMLTYLGQLPEDLAVMEISGGVNANTVPAQAFLEIDPCSGFQFPMAKKMNQLFRSVKRLESEFMLYKDADFTPAYPTLNMGEMHTQESGVAIAATVRLPPIITNEIYETWMEMMRKNCAEIRADFRISDYKRPYRTNSQSSFVGTALDVLKLMKHGSDMGTHSSTNEASLFSRTGVECISFGPGVRDANIHTPNEHVRLGDLHSATEFYFQMMQRMCL